MGKKLGILLIVALLFSGCSMASMEIGADFALAAPEMAMANETDAVMSGVNLPEKRSTAKVEFYMPLIFSVLQSQTESEAAEDGTKLYFSQRYAPTVHITDEEAETWLAGEIETITHTNAERSQQIRQQALDDYDCLRLEEDAGTAEFYAYSYYSDIRTARLDCKVVSLLQNDSIYSGGAAPTYMRKAYNFDLESRTKLSLSDVFFSDVHEELLDLLLFHLDNRLITLENVGLFPEYRQTISALFVDPDTMNDWYFTDAGLIFFFQSAQLSPDAEGFVKVELPYESLASLLRPEFFPEEQTEGVGDVLLLESPEQRKVLHPLPEETAGNCIYLSAANSVYDVCLYRLSSWISDDTPIVSQMVFSSNWLGESTAICIAEPSQDATPEYLLSYRTGTGERHALTVTRQELQRVSNYISD